MANDFDEMIDSISPRQEDTNDTAFNSIRPNMNGTPFNSYRRKAKRSGFWRRVGTGALAFGIFITSFLTPMNLTTATAENDIPTSPEAKQTATASQDQQHSTATADENRRREDEALQRALDAVRARVTARENQKATSDSTYHTQTRKSPATAHVKKARIKQAPKTHIAQQPQSKPRTEAQRALFEQIKREYHQYGKKHQQAQAQREAEAQAKQRQATDRIKIAAMEIKQRAADFFEKKTTKQPEAKATVTKASPNVTGFQGVCRQPFSRADFIGQLCEDATVFAQKERKPGTQKVPASAYEICKKPFDLGAFLRTADTCQTPFTSSAPPSKNPSAKSEPVVVSLQDSKKRPVVHPEGKKTKVAAERVRVVLNVAPKADQQPAETPKAEEQKPKKTPEQTVKNNKKKPHKDTQQAEKPAATEQQGKDLPKVVSPSEDEIPGLLRDKFGITTELFNSLSVEHRSNLRLAASLGGVNFEAYKQSIDPSIGTIASTCLFDVADALYAKDNSSYVAEYIYKQACDVARQSEFMLSPRASASIGKYATLLINTARVPQAVYMASIAVLGDNTNKTAQKVLNRAAEYDQNLTSSMVSRVHTLNSFGAFGSLKTTARTILQRTQEAANKSRPATRPVSYQYEQPNYQPLDGHGWNATASMPTNG